MGQSSYTLMQMIMGVFISFLTGLIALKFLTYFINKGKFYYFAFYCWFVGFLFYVYF